MVRKNLLLFHAGAYGRLEQQILRRFAPQDDSEGDAAPQHDSEGNAAPQDDREGMPLLRVTVKGMPVLRVTVKGMPPFACHVANGTSMFRVAPLAIASRRASSRYFLHERGRHAASRRRPHLREQFSAGARA